MIWFDLIWFDSGIRWTLAPQPSHPKNKEKRGTKETKIEIEKSKVHQTNSRAVSLKNQSDSGAYHRLWAWGSVKSGARWHGWLERRVYNLLVLIYHHLWKWGRYMPGSHPQASHQYQGTSATVDKEEQQRWTCINAGGMPTILAGHKWQKCLTPPGHPQCALVQRWCLESMWDWMEGLPRRRGEGRLWLCQARWGRNDWLIDWLIDHGGRSILFYVL